MMGPVVCWLVTTISMLIISNNKGLANKLEQVNPHVAAGGKADGVSLNVTKKYLLAYLSWVDRESDSKANKIGRSTREREEVLVECGSCMNKSGYWGHICFLGGVVIDNGILQVTIANPDGFVTAIRYNGVDNLLEFRNEESNRGYFDVVWDAPGCCVNASNVDYTDRLTGKSFKIISNCKERLEISFCGQWNQASWNTDNPTAPINVDRRYVMLKGLSGYYSYYVLEHDARFPAANLHQIRAVYKLNRGRFNYMAVSDDRRRIMPTSQDRDTGEVMAYKEAARLRNPVNSDMKGEVDDKYQYSCQDQENKVHGWMSSKPKTGFWIITPSNEFRTAGPFKQDLTSHVGPTCLQMFHSAHYAGPDVAIAFQEGEPWKKVFGPFLVYLNSNKENASLWDDAKRQMVEETNKWPFDFPLSELYAKPVQRGSVLGRLLVNDRCGNNTAIPAMNAWVGLAAPGEVGSWQTETKGYQFWVVANKDGWFAINGVLQGTYNLYATVLGFIGDYKYDSNIQIKAGEMVVLGNLTYEPPRNGPTLWEIGIPDRTASEFFVPDTHPNLVNKLFLNSPQHKFRQYGLWEQYSHLYPKEDLVYNIGNSNFYKDWFFAQVTRFDGKVCKPTTWKIVFPMENLAAGTNYTLRIAIASASHAEVQVRINDPVKVNPDFTTKRFGKDNAIARHGIHGLYWLFSVDVASSWFCPGLNAIYLTQPRCRTFFEGVMYDYIRLEGPTWKA